MPPALQVENHPCTDFDDFLFMGRKVKEIQHYFKSYNTREKFWLILAHFANSGFAFISKGYYSASLKSFRGAWPKFRQYDNPANKVVKHAQFLQEP